VSAATSTPAEPAGAEPGAASGRAGLAGRVRLPRFVTGLAGRVRLPRFVTGLAERAGRSRTVAVVVEVTGVVIACWAGAVLSVLGAFLTPVRVGTILVPVAVILAVVGNAMLVRFVRQVTDRTLPALLPGAVWLTLSFVASARTTEGDLVLYQSNWVATVYLLAGAITIGVAGYRMIAPERPSRP
jgi:ABC-type antimicrobial peptide transport system permease subunit